MMSDNIQKIPFTEQKFEIVVTSSNNPAEYTPLNPVEVSHPNSQPEQVCIVITDPNQPKQFSNTMKSVQNMISYTNALPNYYYIGQEFAATPSSESNTSPIAPNKIDVPNLGFLPATTQPQLRNTPSIFSPVPPTKNDSPSSMSSDETLDNSVEIVDIQNYVKNLDKRLRKIEKIAKETNRLTKINLQNQEDLKKQFEFHLKFASAHSRQIGSERSMSLPNSHEPPIFRVSSQPETTTLIGSMKSSASDSPPFFLEAQKDDPNSPNLTIDVNYPLLIDGLGHRSPHKYNSHSCSMYNKSIRDFSDPETMAWLEKILPTLGPGVTLAKIQEVISQTNTITHFTAEFQKVVFTNNERKTLTTSGKFRKRKLERIVLGPLDTEKLQAIIQLSLYLFGVTVADEERVKYQLKQAIDEKNRREFYREDRGTKRAHLSSTPY